MTLFPYGEKPSDNYRAAKYGQQLMGDDIQAGRYSLIAIVRALKASQALGKAALNEQG